MNIMDKIKSFTGRSRDAGNIFWFTTRSEAESFVKGLAWARDNARANINLVVNDGEVIEKDGRVYRVIIDR